MAIKKNWRVGLVWAFVVAFVLALVPFISQAAEPGQREIELKASMFNWDPNIIRVNHAVKLRTLLQDDTRIGYEVLSRLTGVVASRLDETRHVLISERLLSNQA